METNDLTQEMESTFIQMFNDYHSQPEVYDNDIDKYIHEIYAEAPNVFPKYPYMSPSSLGSCPRGLYYKHHRAKKDNLPRQPHQARWQRIGTSVGDIMQRDILFMEKHLKDVAGYEAPFKFIFNEDGTPMFEEFAKKNHPVTYDGVSFYLFGAPDGVMTYTDESGEEHKVLLEIKSKQTTYARTGEWSMREAERKHIMQTIAYAIMFDLEYVIITYQNLSKKGWELSPEDEEKYPDLRAFAYRITDEDKEEVLRELSSLVGMFNERICPLPDLREWTFNNYKIKIATDITDEELALVEEDVAEIQENSTNKMEVNSVTKALAELKFIRELYKDGKLTE